MALEDFLDVAEQFQLGRLDTERAHPETWNLSELALTDLPAAIESLKTVDRDALRELQRRMPNAAPLSRAIQETLAQGDRIFLCGCGATGRLSISLEIFAREGLLPGATAETIFGFMAGGDAALIRSIERFEDRPDYGERQLRELGFRDGDLLISSTEGGETPFVIGATEAAAQISTRAPWFLYCNPDALLCEQVERSRRVIENPAIQKIDLSVGPMALSGSTRMQASTVLMAAIGFAMSDASLDCWIEWAMDLDWSFLATFIEAEADAYRAGEYVIYEPGEYGITVLTDTTERSPTFALTPFEREGIDELASLSYLRLPAAETAADAWELILNRPNRPLEWGELRHLTNAEAMMKFDLSRSALEKREARTNQATQHRFQIFKDEQTSEIVWKFREHEHRIAIPPEIDILGENLLLKLLLNTHSTLIMGRLGRYEGNVMTWVAANNFKLIDRATRYAQQLLKRDHGLIPSYEVVAQAVIEERENITPDQPVVLRVVEKFTRIDQI